jgi:hypothetical protein
VVLPELVPQIAPPVLPPFEPDIIPAYPDPAYSAQQGPNVIVDDSNEPIANIFCFSALANRHSGIVYHDLTGSFPFMSFDGSVCFFVLYHYESNAILVTPIAGLDNVSIFNAYKKYFKNFRDILRFKVCHHCCRSCRCCCRHRPSLADQWTSHVWFLSRILSR